MDDKRNEVSEEEATKMNIVEYDKNGNRVNETYMLRTRENPHEKEELTWNDTEIDPNSELLKNVVDYNQKSRVHDLLDQQKTK